MQVQNTKRKQLFIQTYFTYFILLIFHLCITITVELDMNKAFEDVSMHKPISNKLTHNPNLHNPNSGSLLEEVIYTL